MNAVVFVVDKGILEAKGSSVSQPARYAGLSGVVAGLAGVLLFFSYTPLTGWIAIWSLLAGMFWLGALWFFYIALKEGDPSRVVPLVGSAVPIFTLLFAWGWLGERLDWKMLVGILLLIVGGLVLSLPLISANGSVSKSKNWQLSGRILGAILLSGAFFAAHFAVAKYIYAAPLPFLALFAYVRVGVGVVSLGLLILLIRRRHTAKKIGLAKKTGWIVASAFLLSKGLGMIALLLQNYAIKVGSVSAVNALQGTQYVFLLILAVLVSVWMPKVFKEALSGVVLWQKVSGIVLIGLGLVLIV